MSDRMDREDRVRGALLGLAWGDVLGCPVEGWRATLIQQVYDCYDDLPLEYPLQRITELGGRVLPRLRPLGLHSDDTQQALALVALCLRPGGWSVDRWSDWLVAAMKNGAWRGYGRSFSAAVHRLQRGSPPHQAGSSSAGIGAAMRTGPLGGVLVDDLRGLATVVMESSLTTHGDIRAAAMAFAVAHAVALLVRGESTEAVRRELPEAVAYVEEEWLEGHVEWTIDRSAGHVISQALEQVLPHLPGEPTRLRELVSDTARPHLMKPGTAHPNQGFALLGGLHALGMGLLPDADPRKALCEIVRQGYDTDTVAAIAGSLLGARFGCTWIGVPRLLDARRLEHYADSMAGRASRPEDLVAFISAEMALGQREREFQRELLARVD